MTSSERRLLTVPSTLENDLETLRREWKTITDVPETPRSMMGIIEYSLGQQRKAEEYVNRALRYFLDPSAPHGLDDELLKTFLKQLPEKCDFAEDTHELTDVDVDDQVSVVLDDEVRRSTERGGIADLLIEAQNEWGVLIELKFSAGENSLLAEGPSQTEYYYQAEYVDDNHKDSYESGMYYLYVHPDSEPAAREAEFVNWTWEDLTVDVLEPFLSEHSPRLPQRTVVQLRELRDDIQDIIGMSEPSATEREKVELYLEHYDAIHDVRMAFEERWEVFGDEWPELLEAALDETELDLSSWYFLAYNNDWGNIFRHGWWRRISDREPISDRDVSNDARISFIHRLEGNRTVALGDRTLLFYFRNAGANEQRFIETFNENFSAAEADIQAALPKTAEITGERRNLIEAEYDIRVDEHDDFFDAYIAALRDAVVDHIVENEQLVSILDQVYDESVSIYD